MGRISAGNITFLIRLPPAIKTLDDSIRELENQVHGRRPQNRKRARGPSFSSHPPGSTTVKTNVYTISRSSGLKNDQKKPRTEPR
jgi:hypothetical protein